MHPMILGAGRRLRPLAKPLTLWLVCTGAASVVLAAPGPRSACPSARAATLERLFSADCAECWSAPAPPARQAPPTVTGSAKSVSATWRFDWITPGTDGAPMAAGALPEAAERVQRLGLVMPGTSQVLQQAHAAAPPITGLRLEAESGPAWQGYFGVQLRLQTSKRTVLPAGSTAWLALVEQVSAGSDGTPQARSLLRSVAGPLPLDSLQPGEPLTHLRALRWPASAEPTHLQARAWIEGPDGRLLAVAADQCR